MSRWIERALDVQPGDLRNGVLLSSCLFLTISAAVIGKVASNALFLAQFPAVQLPYADLASGVLVGFVVAAYLLLGRRTSLGRLLVWSPLFFAVSCAFFWTVAHYYLSAWVYPVFYIWVGIIAVLAPTQIWTLANYLLTTREAKRIFGMVGSGGICGWIFAGYFSRVVAKAFSTESLLLGMAALLLLCSALMAVLSNGGQLRLDPARDRGAGVAGTGQKSLWDSVRSVISSNYLRAIAAVICISSFTTTLTGWQFKALVKQSSQGKEALAIFFGDFFFYAGLLALIFQLLLGTRLLRRFGIGPMLFVLPVVVLAGSAGVLVLGTVGAALLLKGSDQVLRYSIDRSAIELLYLPMPQNVKLQAKWFIDTVVWRLGDGLAGLVVLIFAAQLRWAPQRLSWIVIVLTAGWIGAVYVAGKQYVALLKDSISQHRFDFEQASTMALDRSTTDFLTSKILASDPEEILYALSLFEVEQQRASHPVIRGLLSHPAPEVRQKALAVLSAGGDKSVLPSIEALLKDPDRNVRTEAMLYLVYHAHIDPLALLAEVGDFADYSVRSAVAAFLARPGEAQRLEAASQILKEMAGEAGEKGQRTRVEVARLLGELPDSFDPLLESLLGDAAFPVKCEAMRSVGTLGKLSLAPVLIGYLSNLELCDEAAQALAKFGDPVVGLLGGYLVDASRPTDARRAVPPILVSIGTPAAAEVLSAHLLERNNSVRFQVISALNKIHQVHPEIELDVQMLETILAAEIMGHYRSYQIAESLRVPGNSDDAVLRAMSEVMRQELERIFRLLGLLYPHLDLHSVHFGLQSNNMTVYDNALEFLENVLNSQLRGVLVPLLDGKVSPRERAAIAERLVHAKVENREQAVAELVASDDPWLKSCGAYAIGALEMISLQTELDKCLEHPDPLLRETARAAKLRLGAAAKP
ncbi:MAG TPA: Npt1/Npt2 family nucleotide transporter [Candidatus Eisenbacteria bacterium]|nr:Npt1/Npt2 family nucleotide transporter [Candidatus Eisenbacteria bacterium]